MQQYNNQQKTIETLFSPCPIGGKTAPNRFVAQAMEGNDGLPGGKISPRAMERYKKLAEGGWGIVVVEALSVTPDSLARKNGMVLNRENLDGFKELVSEFKKINKEALILFQITHSGSRTGSFSRRVRICPDEVDGVGGEFLTSDEIEQIRQAFVESVLLAEEAGADGVDFKLCHGYFGGEMLRPSNSRNDEWGGSFENRTRFLRKSIPEIKNRLKSEDFILGSRISFFEGVRGGCGTADSDEIIEEFSEMSSLIRLMDELGIDYVNVSAGIPGITSEITRPGKQAKRFYLNHFRYAKTAGEQTSNLRVIGSAYTILADEAPAAAAENIRKGYTDFVGFGRRISADPLYPKKLKSRRKN